LASVLFMAREPLDLVQLAEVTGVPQDQLVPVLEDMVRSMAGWGIQVFKVAGGYLMGTNHENAEFVEKILHPKEETRLSPRALDTLSIIAYKQPVTRAEVERLRGVDSGWVIDSLIAKRMVRETGRSDAVGRPYLYATTEEFLRHFGLKDLSDLPPLPAAEAEQGPVFQSALQETAGA
ncbi:MAG: SMC-Scp complex subunit ScpB, partial [Candidatus Margulisbacteria bacterium]|nr:SMC-Scp complex subunit ScpB [Candidatus Margulisiibacteriota bacterium]